MRKAIVGLCIVALAATGCGTGTGGSSDERIALVDYSSDEFASFVLENFPKQVTVTPGMTVVFKQTWTGEPHTVTGGKLVDAMMGKAKYLIPFFEAFEGLMSKGVELPDPESDEGSKMPAGDFLKIIEDSKADPERTNFLEAWDDMATAIPNWPARDKAASVPMSEINKIIGEQEEAVFANSGLPWAFEETEDGEGFIAQNAGQPCYLTSGGPPKEPEKACTEAQQKQPEFDGTQTYYNSGMIPYEGARGNTFRVPISDDIQPGTYFFYCAVHGPGQATELKVAEAGTEVPSQAEVTRQTRKELETFIEPMRKTFTDAADGAVELEGEQVKGPFAGLSPPVHGAINEFVPKTLNAKAGEPITWKFMGSDHTVTFDVPEYFPIMEFLDDGTVRLNPKLVPAAGGSRPVPETEGGEDEEGPPPGPVKHDAGTWDGSGFWSSGLIGAQPYLEYTMRISKPGTYRYACLLHPPMVGTVVVT